ncbi:MAG: MGH1-like glycoside hydrolase domain-containing protein, partial [Candidatus Hinthialibacter sp.]
EPVMGPGGAYGENWWQLDSSLTCDGAKWANPSFAEGVLRGFASVQSQNPDGRIDLWGGSPCRGMPALASSIPRLFEVGYRTARRSSDDGVRRLAFEVLSKYLEWWLSPVKRDAQTGLITSVFEETLSEPVEAPQTIAPIDLQTAVALGCAYVSELAEWTGEIEAGIRYGKAFEDLKKAVNKYCWDEEDGAYYNFNVKTMTRSKRLIVSTFDPMRLNIAPEERVERLLEKLTDPALFNWGSRPLTSLAKTAPDYVEAEGPYDGRAWFGDIWTMRNLPVIFGLRDCGRDELAAELAWSTVKTFHGNYAEYVTPSKGKGEGVARYGWSASQYIQTIIELIFGVDYDAVNQRLSIAPFLVPELRAHRIAIEDLRLPTLENSRLTLVINPCENGETEIDVTVKNVPAGVSLVVHLDGIVQESPLASEQRITLKRQTSP